MLRVVAALPEISLKLRRRSLAAGLAAVLATTGGPGCAPEPEPVRLWRVAQRLLRPSDPHGPLTPDRCAVGRISRLAAGCLGWMNARAREVSRNPELGIVNYRLRAGEARERFVIDRRYRSDPDAPWTQLPSLLWRGRAGRMQVPLPAPAGAETLVHLRPAPPRKRTLRTAPLRVPEGTVLEGELGLQTPLPDPGGPIVFRIDAEHDGRATSRLLDRVSDPARAGDRWLPYRIDLGAFEGDEIVLRFESEPAESGAQDDGRSFPAWSRPRLLEPDVLASGEIRDVLLVSFDTLRADHLGSYGSPRPTTPHLDAFAEQALLFESAQTSFPSTTASHMSLLTGLYPRVHGVRRPTLQLSPAAATLGEILAGAGFATAGFTENGMITQAAGFYRGLDLYREFRASGPRRETGRISDVFDAGLAWLAAHPDQRAFLLLHTYQVHGPYRPPEAFDLFDSDADGIAPLERARRAYAGEVRYADSEFQRLLDGLERLGRLDGMAIVVTSDHGEGFGEHSVGHGTSLHQTELHVPLLLRLPGGPTERRSAPVSLVDLVPTLVELLELEVDAPFQGRSLVPLLASADAPGFDERAVFAERGPDGAVVAVRRGEEKWILGGPQGPEHFDLARDPGEWRPSRDPVALAPGERLLGACQADARRLRERLRGGAPQSVPVHPDTEAELRALGYLD